MADVSPWAGLALLLLVGLLVYWLALVAWTIHALVRPPRRTYASAVARGKPGDPGEMDRPRPFTAWTLRSAGRDLAVWDVPGDLSGEHAPVVVVTHGWGSGKVSAIKQLPAITPHAGRVVFWDLPGHGQSQGLCTLGLREADDLLALIDRLDAGGPLVLCGSSMGAGVSIEAAARSPGVALVIAEAPYRLAPTPARNVMRQRHAPTRLNLAPALACIGLAATGRWTGPSLDRPGRPFDRCRHAAALGCPLWVLHGLSDATCPAADGQAIAQACPQGRFVAIEGGTHHNLWTEPSCRATMERAYAQALSSLRSDAHA